MRSMPGTARNTGAIEGRAATDNGCPEKWRRTSRMAGSAMIASPSQLGARIRISDP